MSATDWIKIQQIKFCFLQCIFLFTNIAHQYTLYTLSHTHTLAGLQPKNHWGHYDTLMT